jgi:ribosome maturation protein SDO1
MSGSGQAFQLVKYKADKNTTFELMTKKGTVLQYQEGKLGLSSVLFADEIFTDQARGLRANEADLIKYFNTTNVEECAKVILEKGELQLTAAERREKVQKKRAEMVNYVHKYYMDPRTKTPHPVVRIEAAFDQLKLNIDPDQAAERQVQEKVLKRLPEVLPIKKCEMSGTLTISNKVVGPAMGLVRKYCQVTGETYTSGNCVMQVSFVPGDYDVFMNDLKAATKGEFSFDVDTQISASTEAPPDSKGKGKKRRRRQRWPRWRRKWEWEWEWSIDEWK